MQDVAKCVPDCRPPTGFQNACPRCGEPYVLVDHDHNIILLEDLSLSSTAPNGDGIQPGCLYGCSEPWCDYENFVRIGEDGEE